MSCILNIKMLKKQYGDQCHTIKAIDDISFEVQEGEFIAIMGASGSGKTNVEWRNVRKSHIFKFYLKGKLANHNKIYTTSLMVTNKLLVTIC